MLCSRVVPAECECDILCHSQGISPADDHDAGIELFSLQQGKLHAVVTTVPLASRNEQ